MRIPRRVNAALDSWSRYVWQPYLAAPGLLVATVTTAGSLIALPFLPEWAWALALLTSGVLLGWTLHAPRVDVLQRKLDDADVMIGSLSEKHRQAVRGQVAESALETHVLPRIGGDNT